MPYSPYQMFKLVADVEKYPEFMPWCSDSKVHSHHERGMQASITMKFSGLEKQFTTCNTHTKPTRIDLELVSGPFSQLTGYWEFQALPKKMCRVLVVMEYKFTSHFLEVLIGPAFKLIANSLIGSFTARAKVLYD